MYREKVTSIIIPVVKTSIVYFPVRLPGNAQRIIAIETGVRVKGTFTGQEAAESFADSFGIMPGKTFGSLRLESPGCSGLFYSTTITEPDSMIGYADFSAVPEFPVRGFSHGGPHYPDPVNIPVQATSLSGVYLNRQPAVNYDLLLHIWTTQKQTT